MGLIAKGGAANIAPIPEDTYQGVCYAIYDIGTQFSEKFGKASHQCIVIWELPELRISVERAGKYVDLPRVVSKKYSLTLNEKSNLRRDLQSWRGKAFSDKDLEGFDITKLIGANCMIQIVHSKSGENIYANIAAILPLYKGVAKRNAENPAVVYEISQGDPPEGTPKWIAEMIAQCAEFNEKHTAESKEVVIDDVPF